MKSILRAGWLAIALAMQGPAHAAEEIKHPTTPLLWKIEGKDLAKPSFLFGTIHVPNKAVVTFHPATTRAFDEADIVYTEIPMDAESQLGATTSALRNDGKLLTDSIGTELTQQLNTELGFINHDLNVQPLESLKTWTVATVLPVLRFQMTGEKALDATVWDRATAGGKETAALEKPEDQLRIFDDLREDEQTAMLTETLKQLQEGRKSGTDPVDALIAAYLSGNSVRLEAELDRQMAELRKGVNKDLADKLNQRVLLDRNVSMGHTISAILAEKPGQSHFFAVGAGHYLGKSSIVELISAEGYRVTRVTK